MKDQSTEENIFEFCPLPRPPISDISKEKVYMAGPARFMLGNCDEAKNLNKAIVCTTTTRASTTSCSTAVLWQALRNFEPPPISKRGSSIAEIKNRI